VVLFGSIILTHSETINAKLTVSSTYDKLHHSGSIFQRIPRSFYGA